MNDILNKQIKTADGSTYVIVDYTQYDQVTYYLGVTVEGGHLGDEIAIFRIETEGNKNMLVIEPNVEICQKVIEQISAKK